MLILVIILMVLALLAAFAATGLSYYLGLRAVGVKASLFVAFKIVLVISLVSILAFVLSYVLRDTNLAIVLVLGWLIGSVVLWHKLLNRYYPVKVRKSLIAYVIGYFISCIFNLLITIFMISFVQTFQVTGNAMNPALENGDRILGYKIGVNPEVNKVVAYNYKMDEERGITVGRILYAPGQTVSVKTKYVTVNGTVAEPSEYTLKEDEYYIVGDNASVTIPRIVAEKDIVAIVGPTLLKAR